MLVSVAFSSFASDKSVAEKREEYERNYLAKNHLAVPDGGVKIVPRSELSQWNKNKKTHLKKQMQLQQAGYVEKNDPYIDRLIHLEEFVKNQKKFKGFEQRSTKLRENIIDLQIAYKYNQIPSDIQENSYGIAPYLSFIKNRGWAGVSELFKSPHVGNCQYFENNIKLTHGSIVLGQEDVQYLVNNKPSLIRIYGNKQQGFVYEVEWYEDKFFKQLSCALPEYGSNVKDKLIELAVQIDDKDS